MLTKGFLKPELSINNLSKNKFWTGIVIGILTSFVLSYFFNYTRESLRSITFMHDPLILTDVEFSLYDLFFASFATSLGFGFTIIYWLGGRNSIIKKRYLQIYTISNSWFVIFLSLMGVARFGSILPIGLYGSPGYDNELDILHEFWIILILLPLYVFFVNWNSIRIIFKSGKWIMFSILFYVIIAFYLFKTTSVDRDIFNNAYYAENKETFDFIDSEFLKAKKYGIIFSDSTRQILRKQSAESTIKLVNKLKCAFKYDRKVTLDTLILEKIAVHNMKQHSFFYYDWRLGLDSIDNNWSYALPEEIYHQIQYHDINSIETAVLFEILHEQILLFTAPEIEWNENDLFNKYSNYELSRNWFRKHLFRSTRTIQSRLIQVIEKLKEDNRYVKYHYLLPVMEFKNERGGQMYFELE